MLARQAWEQEDGAGVLQQFFTESLGRKPKRNKPREDAALQNLCGGYSLLFGCERIHLILAPSLSPWRGWGWGVGHHFSIYYPGAHPRRLDSLKNRDYKMRLWEKQDSLPCLRLAFREPAISLDNWLWDDCPSQGRPCVLPGTRPLLCRPQQDIRIQCSACSRWLYLHVEAEVGWENSVCVCVCGCVCVSVCVCVYI